VRALVCRLAVSCVVFAVVASFNDETTWAIRAHQHSHRHVVQHFLTSAYARCFFGLTNVHHCEQSPHRIALIGASSARACHATPAYCGGSSLPGATLPGRPIVRPQLHRNVLTIAITLHPNRPSICHFCASDCIYSCPGRVFGLSLVRRERTHVLESWHVCVVFASPTLKSCQFARQLSQFAHQVLSFSVFFS
jgi:hypothetical protein